MPNASIQLADQRTEYSPRETVTGKVTWQLETALEKAELRLVWSTQGRATTADFDIVQTLPFPDPQATETRPFTLTLPEAPYSFSGALIKLSWVLELTFTPGNFTESIDLVLAPGGQAISLPRVKSA